MTSYPTAKVILAASSEREKKLNRGVFHVSVDHSTFLQRKAKKFTSPYNAGTEPVFCQ